jgi:hypothetical protein
MNRNAFRAFTAVTVFSERPFGACSDLPQEMIGALVKGPKIPTAPSRKRCAQNDVTDKAHSKEVDDRVAQTRPQIRRGGRSE